MPDSKLELEESIRYPLQRIWEAHEEADGIVRASQLQCMHERWSSNQEWCPQCYKTMIPH